MGKKDICLFVATDNYIDINFYYTHDSHKVATCPCIVMVQILFSSSKSLWLTSHTWQIVKFRNLHHSILVTDSSSMKKEVGWGKFI